MKITKTEAMQIARQECERRGWPWQEPILIHWGFFSFTVRTNTQRRGGNVSLRIRKRDGVVVGAAFADR